MVFISGAIGYLVPNMEAKIVDPETGKELSYGTDADRGELWLRGQTTAKIWENRFRRFIGIFRLFVW